MQKFIITEAGRDKIYDILDDSIIIGSGPDADLKLKDPDLSLRHLSVKRQGEDSHVRIIDLETKSGTKVNGKTINQHTLSNGDTIEIGALTLTYIGPGPDRPRIDPRKAVTPPKAVAQSEGPDEDRPFIPPAPRPLSRPMRKKSGWGDSLGPQGKKIVLVLLSLAATLIVYWIVKSAGEPSNIARERLMAARDAVKTVTTDTIAAAKTKLDAADRVAESESQKKELVELRGALQEFERSATTGVKKAKAVQAYEALKSARATGDSGSVKVLAMARQFITDFDDVDLAEEFEVRRWISEIERSPIGADRAVTNLIAESEKFLGDKEYRKALQVLENADKALKTVYAEEIDKAGTRIKRASRAAVTNRKNQLRDLLKQKKPTEAEKAVEEMLEKLVWSTIDDYLASPDGGYSSAETTRLELEAQTMMKNALARRRGR